MNIKVIQIIGIISTSVEGSIILNIKTKLPKLNRNKLINECDFRIKLPRIKNMVHINNKKNIN